MTRLALRSPLAATALGLLLVLGAGARAQNEPPPPPQPPSAQPADPQPEQGVDVLARGPVHEAYAEPTETRPEASPVITKQPPEPVAEMPPEEKPEGDVIWIPGYWSYDDEKDDFVWVSGFWRLPPPHRRWLPGHWQQVEGGWQWVAGFWTPDDQEEAEYVPPPPPSLDTGPSTPAADEDSTYVPGCWIYRESRYWWRPGFWVPFKEGWCWIPAHYVWTPNGCLFVEGYWDYPLDERGLLFAPVEIDRSLLARRDWEYVPQYVVQSDFLLGALFVGPGRHHYHFGDYFEPGYERRGYVPWIDYRTSKVSYDPNFAYYRHEFAKEPGWERGLKELYAARRSGDVPRPPRTLAQQARALHTLTTNRTAEAAVHRNVGITHTQNVSVLAPLGKVNNTRVTHLSALAGVTPGKAPPTETHARAVRLEKVNRQQRVQEQKAAAQLRAAAQERHQAEARLLSEGHTPTRPTDPARAVKLPGPKRAPAAPPGPAPRPAAPPARPAAKTPPPPPAPPKHEDRPIPRHEPPQPARPPLPAPRKEAPPPPPPPRKEPPTPPKHEAPPPPPKQPAPPPPKHEAPPPKPPPPPPPPPKKEAVLGQQPHVREREPVEEGAAVGSQGADEEPLGWKNGSRTLAVVSAVDARRAARDQTG
jgi:hypothetical protein